MGLIVFVPSVIYPYITYGRHHEYTVLSFRTVFLHDVDTWIQYADICLTGAVILDLNALVGAKHQLRRFIAL